MHGRNELSTLFLLILIGVYADGEEQRFVNNNRQFFIIFLHKIHHNIAKEGIQSQTFLSFSDVSGSSS